MLLYSTGKDPSKEKWDGASTRFEDAVALFGADDARPLENFVDDLRALAARAEHVYVDAPAQHHHRHRAHRAHHRHHGHAAHRRGASSSATASLLKYYFSRGQRAAAAADDLDADAASESYFDVVSACKQRPLAPLVGKLRGVKSVHEIEVLKASAEISARAHAKVSTSCGVVLVTFMGLGWLAGWLAGWLMRARNRRCALLSPGFPKPIFRPTLSMSARGAVRSALRTFPSSHLG
jgi:Xaa-Pro aminopeptidase